MLREAHKLKNGNASALSMLACGLTVGPHLKGYIDQKKTSFDAQRVTEREKAVFLLIYLLAHEREQ